MGSLASKEPNNEYLHQTIRDLDAENKELKKQLSALKNINIMNQAVISANQTVSKDKKTTTIKPSDVSNEKINDFIDKLLKTDTNIKYLPDFVERQIYQNILTMGLNILDDMLETTSIQFVGHEIKFDLRTAESETKV